MNPFFHLSVCSSMVSWFVVILITGASINFFFFSRYTFVAQYVLATPNFWFYLPLACVIALFPVIAVRTFSLDRFPKRLNRLQIDMSDRITEDIAKSTPRNKSSVRRSGYAFAQIRGFGQLITSGYIFGLSKKEVEEERQVQRGPHSWFVQYLNRDILFQFYYWTILSSVHCYLSDEFATLLRTISCYYVLLNDYTWLSQLFMRSAAKFNWCNFLKQFIIRWLQIEGK